MLSVVVLALAVVWTLAAVGWSVAARRDTRARGWTPLERWVTFKWWWRRTQGRRYALVTMATTATAATVVWWPAGLAAGAIFAHLIATLPEQGPGATLPR